MAAFSFQPHHRHPFLLDSAHLPILQHQFEEMNNASSCFLYHHKPESIPNSPTTEPITYESNHPSLEAQMMDYSVSVKVETQLQGSTEKKRKYRDGSCMTFAQSQETEDIKSKKQRKLRAVGMKETKACGEPPVGYIHVRARRGQATDSHSLAERARREKISERMKLLQALVPGCNKVVGKALVLDEIINYVQSLQSQVEFLSMKLASVNPMSYHFGVNQSEQGPIAFSQDNGALLMQVGDQRHEFLNQFLLNNMCSFQ